MNLLAFTTILPLLWDPRPPETWTPVPLDKCTTESVQRILNEGNVGWEVQSVSPKWGNCTITFYPAPKSTPLPGSEWSLRLKPEEWNNNIM